MEITWYGLSCFKLADRGSATVVTNPDDLRTGGEQPLKLTTDIVTLSHEVPETNFLEAVQGTPYVITGAGEYEVGNVFITGIQTHSAHGGETRNTLFVFDYDGLTVAHLGNLDHVPTQAEIEAIGTVKIALVPISNELGLTPAKAAEVISLLEPGIVIPMYDTMSGGGLQPDSLSKFLKEMGISEAVSQMSLKISNTALPEDTKVIVLVNRHAS